VCRRQSWESSHRYECPYLDLLVKSGTGLLSLLTVKLLLTTGLQRLLKVHRRQTSNGGDKSAQSRLEASLNTNSAGVFMGGYTSLHCLLGHSTNRAAADLLQYTVLAIWITIVLRQSGFFADDKLFAQVCMGTFQFGP
jgi:hypothetical protein